MDKEQKIQTISYQFSDKTFEIKNREWIDFLQLEQIDYNTEGTNEICLSGIEIFGMLRRKSQNENNSQSNSFNQNLQNSQTNKSFTEKFCEVE